ncbi:hypothetical protein HYH02_000080 [Chlamydomonas schloesseri]|uniref:Uncharacterized protein n=1 Tax=Chlamydomonas schloesseri TaxID=2026947 RepID=A0A836B7G6_9CHLO|nr:hypothetical protein HYH02_000080 [Chlamydomonas schloesseri]|eukprot:KAG2449976.1 hypothetical protein HYH02_000080 [Chlamydomonas schloesseri]
MAEEVCHFKRLAPDLPCVLRAAVAAGDLEACKRLLHEGCELWPSTQLSAARRGHLHILQWMRDIGFIAETGKEVNPSDVYGSALAACAAGHAHVLAWLEGLVGGDGTLAQPPPSPEWMPGLLAVEAARAGHTQLLAVLARRIQPRNRRDRYEGRKVLAAIAFGCPLEVLQRYYRHGSAGGAGEAGTFASGADSDGEGSGKSDGEGGGEDGGAGGGGSSWTGEAPLRGVRAREMLSAALASPLPDWRQKVQWLLSQCEGCPAAALQALTLAPASPQASPKRPAPAAPFEVCGETLVTAPEDGDDGASTAEGDGSSNSGDGDGGGSIGNGFSARLAAVRQLGLTLVFPKGRTPDTWHCWGCNAALLVLHLLPDTRDPQMRQQLLDTAARQRCLPVLHWFLENAGPAAFRKEHVFIAVEGRRFCERADWEESLLAVFDLFDRDGVLPPRPVAAVTGAAAAAAEVAAAAAAIPAGAADGARGSGATEDPAEGGLDSTAVGAVGEEPQPHQQEQREASEQEMWDSVLMEAVRGKAGMRVARYLQERCGARPAVVDLALAGCSVEMLRWAHEESLRYGLPVEFTPKQMWILCLVNPAAASWLCERGLARPPTFEQVFEILLTPPLEGGAFSQIRGWLRLVQSSAMRALSNGTLEVAAVWMMSRRAWDLLVRLLDVAKWELLPHQRDWLLRMADSMAVADPEEEAGVQQEAAGAQEAEREEEEEGLVQAEDAQQEGAV